MKLVLQLWVDHAPRGDPSTCARISSPLPYAPTIVPLSAESQFLLLCLLVSITLKHAATVSALNMKFPWSYIFPQLLLYVCVLLARETRKMC